MKKQSAETPAVSTLKLSNGHIVTMKNNGEMTYRQLRDVRASLPAALKADQQEIGVAIVAASILVNGKGILYEDFVNYPLSDFTKVMNFANANLGFDVPEEVAKEAKGN